MQNKSHSKWLKWKKASAPITGATEVLRFFSSAGEIATTSEN